MPKMTLGELYEYYKSFNSISVDVMENIKGKAKTLLVYNAIVFNTYLQDYIAYRSKMVEKYATDADCINMIINAEDTENINKFRYAMKDINSFEIKVPLLFISIDDIIDGIPTDGDSTEIIAFLMN